LARIVYTLTAAVRHSRPTGPHESGRRRRRGVCRPSDEAGTLLPLNAANPG